MKSVQTTARVVVGEYTLSVFLRCKFCHSAINLTAPSVVASAAARQVIDVQCAKCGERDGYGPGSGDHGHMTGNEELNRHERRKLERVGRKRGR